MKKIDKIRSFEKHSDRYKWLNSLRSQPPFLICRYDLDEIKLEMEICLMKLLDLYPRCNSPCEQINELIKNLKNKQEELKI